MREYDNLFELARHSRGDGPAVHVAVMNLVHAPAGDSLFLKVAPDCVTTSVFSRSAHPVFIAALTGRIVVRRRLPTVMYYQDKLGGSGLQHLFVCWLQSDIGRQLAELHEKLGVSPQRIEPLGVDDIFSSTGSVHLAWQNLI